ncbi:hypothetical protein COHA_004514 [Chlorella ohadii]|uniref:Calcineurin-like phosphoesterase domain-containing protein n=1 Tax=Chlorella ohadii TaxID=2649997 RepID=A0AAD5H6B5_9CHLO|nr:hypothetical protein COHA_004514 [Chlorella ohadii]
MAALETALATLKSKFGHVFYVPGNHELWIRERDRDMGITDSHTKLRIILERCRQLGVHTRPTQLGGLWIVPLLSWHHRSFDKEPDVPGVPPASAWTITDYSACRWPSSVPGSSTDGSEQLAAYIDSMNNGPEWQTLLASRAQCDVISFSHFLPDQSLLPEKRYLYYPNLAKAVGSDFLAARVAQLQPDLHLFGHTHFAWDACIGGTRYIQAPLCSPLERRKRLFTVGFGACMAEAEADPVAARWLPQQVYVGLAPPSAPAQGEAAGGADQQQTVQQQQQPMRAEWRPQPQEPPAGTAAAQLAGGQAAGQAPQDASSNGSGGSGQQAEAQPGADQQQPRKAEGGYDPMPAVARLQLQIEMELAFGWQPLRHGAAVPSLLAHWSMYYEEHPRQPDVVTLAPWVARLYERRLHRRQRAAAGVMRSTAGAEEGNCGEVEGEVTALTSMSESDNESAIGF